MEVDGRSVDVCMCNVHCGIRYDIVSERGVYIWCYYMTPCCNTFREPQMLIQEGQLRLLATIWYVSMYVCYCTAQLGPGHTTSEMTATATARWRFISHTTRFVTQMWMWPSLDVNVDVTMAATLTATSTLTKSEVRTKAMGIVTKGWKPKAKWAAAIEKMLANVLGGHFRLELNEKTPFKCPTFLHKESKAARSIAMNYCDYTRLKQWEKLYLKTRFSPFSLDRHNRFDHIMTATFTLRNG